MSKILMLLADGFEETEALATRDILIRGGQEVVMAAIENKLEVESQTQVKVIADILLKDVVLGDFAALVLPGGGLGTANLKESQLVTKVITYFNENNKVIGAICAAPTILGELGMLKDKKYTCYQGCEKRSYGEYTHNKIEVVGNIVMARSMKYSIEFGFEILKKLNPDILLKVNKRIEG